MIWTILGMSVAIIAAFCVSVSETLVGNPLFESLRPYAAGALAITGIIAWFVGRSLGERRRARGEEARFVLFDLRYWGPMFVILGVITLFIWEIRTRDTGKPVATAPPKKKVEQVAVVKKPEPPSPPPVVKPVVFPAMKIQGVIFRSSAPYAIINGQSYTIGDHLGDVVVKAIDRSGVMLELGGELKVLTLN
jgi:hypothetical protein